MIALTAEDLAYVIPPAAQLARRADLHRRFMTPKRPRRPPMTLLLALAAPASIGVHRRTEQIVPDPPKPAKSRSKGGKRKKPERFNKPKRPINTGPRVPYLAIVRAVAESSGITDEKIAGERGCRNTCRVRQVVAWLARELTPLSFPAIADRLGGRDHSTIVHAINKVSKAVATGDELGAWAVEMRQRLIDQMEAAPC